MRRRTALLFLSLAAAGCHRSQAATSVAVAPLTDADPSTSSAILPIDSGSDPSLLSRSSDSESQIEPHLAVSTNGAVATAWMDVRSGQMSVIGVRFSTNGGDDWQPVQTIASPEGRSAAEPVVGMDDTGATYLSWLGFRPGDGGADRRDTHIYVSAAAAGATALAEPIDLTASAKRGTTVEKPWMTVTPTGVAFVSWAYESTIGNGIRVAQSKDGRAWKESVVIERVSLQAIAPYVCASRGGEHVWVAYLDDEVGVRVRASDDGGTIWSPSRVATVNGADEQPHIGHDAAACVGEGDDVTVVYGRTRGKRGDARSASLDSLVIARSFDGGRTFDSRRTVDLPEPGMHPQIVREPDGAIDVAYYAAGATPETGSLRWVRIADAGAAATTPRVVRDHVLFAREIGDASLPGDYFGLAFHEGKLFAASIDASGGAPHVAFTRIAAR